jgi:hypothetical protein
MVSALDNLAWEVNNLGLESYGSSQVPIPLLLGVWKIVRGEKEPHDDWEQAANGLWAIISERGSLDDAYSIALYLLLANDVDVVALGSRFPI